jgi:hypothetical protein
MRKNGKSNRIAQRNKYIFQADLIIALIIICSVSIIITFQLLTRQTSSLLTTIKIYYEITPTSQTKQSYKEHPLTLGSLSPSERGTRDFAKAASLHLDFDRTIIFKLSSAEDFDYFLVTVRFYISNSTSLIATIHFSEDHFQQSLMFRNAITRLNAGDYDVHLSVQYEVDESSTSYKSGEVIISVYG